MNKVNNTTTSCTTASTLTNNKVTREILKNKQVTSITNGTSGCLYVTNVNLYLHPNASHETPDVSTIDIKKVKTRCYNSDCFYYDPCVSDDYFYCCNPVCCCFKPDWYCYL